MKRKCKTGYAIFASNIKGERYRISKLYKKKSDAQKQATLLTTGRWPSSKSKTYRNPRVRKASVC